MRDVDLPVAYDPPAGEPRAVFVCAHGAGGNMDDRAVRSASGALRSRGLGVVRFNFPYTEHRSRRPDPMPVLMETVAAVAQHVREMLSPRTLLLGGRSMGGRAASMLAADGCSCDGLLLLAYPLHPAGMPSRRRDAHLAAIAARVLCVNGTRDALCDRALMEESLARRKPRDWTMHWIEGADHSFHVLKRSGRTDADVLDELGAAVLGWLDAS